MIPLTRMGIESLRGFRTLPEQDRKALAAATREQHHQAGTVLFHERQPATHLWAVARGLVRMVKLGRDGREMILQLIPPGELFGAMAALDERPYPASAVTVEDCLTWRIPAALARDLCQRYPVLRATILDQVARRLREAHDRLRSVAFDRVDQRLARMLLTLADKIGRADEGTAVLTLTRQQLADMVGTTVETAIRVTRKWHEAGIIATARQQLRIVDPNALRRIAEGTPP